MSTNQVAIAPRRKLVQHLFDVEGCKVTDIASTIDLHRSTVRSDFIALHLTRRSSISNYDLDEAAAGILLVGHLVS